MTEVRPFVLRLAAPRAWALPESVPARPEIFTRRHLELLAAPVTMLNSQSNSIYRSLLSILDGKIEVDSDVIANTLDELKRNAQEFLKVQDQYLLSDSRIGFYSPTWCQFDNEDEPWKIERADDVFWLQSISNDEQISMFYRVDDADKLKSIKLGVRPLSPDGQSSVWLDWDLLNRKLVLSQRDKKIDLSYELSGTREPGLRREVSRQALVDSLHQPPCQTHSASCI